METEMEVNIKDLTPSYSDIEKNIKEKLIIIRKLKALHKWMQSNFPAGIKGKYSYDDVGKTCIRCFIYLDSDDTDSVMNLLKWMKELKGKRFKAEKFFREESGKFSYKLERHYEPYYSYLIFFENGKDLDGCVIKKKKVMKTIYETDCERATVEF